MACMSSPKTGVGLRLALELEGEQCRSIMSSSSRPKKLNKSVNEGHASAGPAVAICAGACLERLDAKSNHRD